MVTQNTQTINYSAYTENITRQQQIDYITSKQDFKLTLIITMSALVLFSILFVYFLGFLGYILYIFPFLAVFIIAYVWYALYSATTEIRAYRFTHDNKFTFEPVINYFQDNGLVFDGSVDGTLFNRYAGIYRGREFWIGNYSYRPSEGEKPRYAGIISVNLPKNLPNVFIDSKKNNFLGINSLDKFYSKKQVLQLEGDFNNYFTIYVPQDYQKDALYFLTPELMALLVDYGQDYDIEVINNTLKFYRMNGFITYNEQVLTEIFKLIEVLGGEFEDNTMLYQDEKSVAENIVDLHGQKLKKGKFRPLTIVIAIIFFIVFVSQFLLVLLPIFLQR